MSRSQPILAATGIDKSYGAVRALADVHFSVSGGEIVALAGENGSGKSTLARILAGVIDADSGRVTVDGRALARSRPRDALAAGVAIVTQELTAVPPLSVAENIVFPTRASALSLVRPRQAVAQARALMDRVGLQVDPLRPFESLPPGDAVRVEIARSLATRPRFLILDEVTTRLGGHDIEPLFTLLEELREGGLGIVFITHRLAEIGRLAHRTVVLRDGRVVGEVPRRHATESRLSTMMVGRQLDEFSRRRATVSPDPALEVRQVMVDGFPGAISLQVGAGEVVGLAGLMGAGRTELLETIAGARPAGSGEIRVNGAPAAHGSVRSARAAGIALVPEDRHRQGLVLHSSVRINAVLGSWRWRSLARVSRERAAARRCVQSMQVKVVDVETPVSQLSGGNQQKVLVGRALAGQPRVLLLDEPTRGIDVGARAEMFHLIERLAGEGVAVLLASSDLREILALCDRVLVLHDHRIVAELPAAHANEERIALLAGGG